VKTRTLLGRAAIVLGATLALLLAWLLVQGSRRPGLDAYGELVLPAASASPVSVRFAGVTTLVFDDGETAFMTDGFFSRPGVWRTMFAQISSDGPAIDAGLARLRVQRLAAVVPLHGHYDHAMDSPGVARRTGAMLIGDASIMLIGRGSGLHDRQMREVSAGTSIRLGKWLLTFVASRHAPTPFSDGEGGGHLDEPLVPPAHATAWKQGQAWSLLIEHDSQRSYLVQGSAGFEVGALRDRRADVVFLGVGAAGKQPNAYRARLWEEVVRAVQARRVILVHWDDMWRGLDQPLQAMPCLADDFAATMGDLRAFAAADGVDLRLPPLFTPFVAER
jgi:L-ascorbate metabolism protein UlaG (beta-lactamase superfamily)